MSVEVQVAIPSLAELVGRLEAFRMDQLPFALSVGMNRAAKDARDRFRPHLGRVFELRSRNLQQTFGPFGSFGGGRSNVRVSPEGKVLGRSSDARGAAAVADGWSHRTQWPNLQVVFGSLAYAMELQETGGQKPRRAPKVWIPTPNVERTANGRKRSRHRKSVLEQRLGEPAKRGGFSVFERKGTVFERDRKSGQVRALYWVRDRAQVPARLGLEGLVVDTYNAKLWPRFSQAMGKALANTKDRNRFTGRSLI